MLRSVSDFNGTKTKEQVRFITNLLVRDGHIYRPVLCDRCDHFDDGTSRIQAHHKDYNQPMDLEWLCQACHTQWHHKHIAKQPCESMSADPEEILADMGYCYGPNGKIIRLFEPTNQKEN